MDDRTKALMEMVEAEIHRLLASGAFYAEARQFLLRTLADGHLHRSRDLVNAYEADPSREKSVFEPLSTPDMSDLSRRLARRAAAIEALGLLVADGIVVGVSAHDHRGVSGGQQGGFEALSVEFEIAWMSGSSGSRGGGSLFIPLPTSPSRIRLARPVSAMSGPLDYQTFVTDLAPLHLDPRTLRALNEAFAAFRGGLFLSTAVLSGTVIEGAVRAMAPRLSPVASVAGRRELGSGQLRTVTKRLIDLLRAVNAKELPSRADQLASHLHRFIDLRNYGAHTGAEDAGLERWFEDDFQSAMILADLRHVLLMLNDAIADRLIVDSGVEPLSPASTPR